MGNTARLYHVGPTRFVVVLTPEFGGDAAAFATELASMLRDPVTCDGIPVTPTVAAGTCEFVLGELTPRDILRRLLNALEDACASEDGHAVYCPTHDLKHARIFMLLNDFKAALEAHDQLALHYQPRIDLATGRCDGAEALLRWTHPQLGPIPPFEFIPALEQTALACPLTEWVARTALKQIAAWRREGVERKVSINVSALNLDEPDFADRILALVDEHGVPPGLLELEFTESAIAKNAERVVRQLEALRDAGIQIAIDDFGSGYSNLSYLQTLPTSVLKIDRAFVTNLGTSVRDQRLVSSMIDMAHGLGYRVVAEGIETQEAYDLLKSWGCDEGQGFLMARPMPAQQIDAWLCPGVLAVA
jgi:EAL domain-containing protein (putative c-di-GMP-specific phosphodiesterase class I)